MDLGLRDRVCVVTGSTAGIGLETARLLVDEGARVVTSGRGERAGRRRGAARRGRPLPTRRARAGGRAPLAELGGVDCLVNNVGAARQANFEDVPDDEWDAYWQLNLMSHVRAIRAALPAMRERGGGAIVNVSSTAAQAAVDRDAALLGDEGGDALAVAARRRPVREGRDPLQRGRRPGRPRPTRGSARAGSPTSRAATATRCWPRSAPAGRSAASPGPRRSPPWSSSSAPTGPRTSPARPGARTAAPSRSSSEAAPGSGRDSPAGLTPPPLRQACWREIGALPSLEHAHRDRYRRPRGRRDGSPPWVGVWSEAANRRRQADSRRPSDYAGTRCPSWPGELVTPSRRRVREHEDAWLSPLAVRSYETRGRERDEEPCGVRTPFQRDRDRIVHSKPFRRLKGKTQVFIDPQGDHYRTRMTHTLETTAISRVVARALRLNEDLTEAIGLGHDLGHTPFGHAGEDALDRALRERFGLRLPPQRAVVPDRARAQPDPRGLRGDPHAHGAGRAGDARGKIVRLVDRVAYINHDIDDALRYGLLDGGRPAARGDRAARPHRRAAASTGSSTTWSRPRPRPATSARARRSAARCTGCATSCSSASTSPSTPAGGAPPRARDDRADRRATWSSAATRPTRSSSTSPG